MQLIHRLDDLLRERPGAVLDDILEIELRGVTCIVAFDPAVRVKRELDQLPQPEWVEFVDQFGISQRVRSQDVLRFSESTPKTRAAVRALTASRA
jgi:hypothetical protein